jgi:hypothetical protein
MDEFGCVCIGNMPWDEDEFLSEFWDTDDASQQLVEVTQEWSTQTVHEGRCF